MATQGIRITVITETNHFICMFPLLLVEYRHESGNTGRWHQKLTEIEPPNKVSSLLHVHSRRHHRHRGCVGSGWCKAWSRVYIFIEVYHEQHGSLKMVVLSTIPNHLQIWRASSILQLLNHLRRLPSSRFSFRSSSSIIMTQLLKLHSPA